MRPKGRCGGTVCADARRRVVIAVAVVHPRAGVIDHRAGGVATTTTATTAALNKGAGSATSRDATRSTVACGRRPGCVR